MKILVFGATSAIAQALIRKLVDRHSTDANFVLVGRTQERVEAVEKDVLARGSSCLLSTSGDFSDREVTINLTQELLTRFGPFDLAVVAHGFLPNPEQLDSSEENQIMNFDVNALSYILILSMVSKNMEHNGKGAIVVLSSVAGDRGRASNYSYGAAKGTVSLFSQGLRNRLFKSGVRILTVKPGLVDTPMTADFEKKGLLWSSPEKVAASICSALDRGKDIVYAPWFWRYIMLVIRLIPEWVFKRLSL